jgi:hypothetical protein
MPPTRSDGNSKRPNPTKPSPPNQQRRERHINMPRGTESSPVSTVAPVAVMPDMDSKKALAKLIGNVEKKKGKEPSRAAVSQMATISRKPKRGVNRISGLLVAKLTSPQRTLVTIADLTKVTQSRLPI